MDASHVTFVVEHLDPELDCWSLLEYATIALESHAAGSAFLLSMPLKSHCIPKWLMTTSGFNVMSQSAEEVYDGTFEKVCLLDPRAEQELVPEDKCNFNVYLFGGILGISLRRLRQS